MGTNGGSNHQRPNQKVAMHPPDNQRKLSNLTRTLQIVIGNHEGNRRAVEEAVKLIAAQKKRKTMKVLKLQHEESNGQEGEPISMFDETSKYTFIVDLEAARSVFLAKNKDLKKTPDLAKLIGSDSEEMKTYGNRKMQLYLETPRNYQQEFTIANVKWPNLRMDFLLTLKWRTNVKRQALISQVGGR